MCKSSRLLRKKEPTNFQKKKKHLPCRVRTKRHARLRVRRVSQPTVRRTPDTERPARPYQFFDVTHTKKTDKKKTAKQQQQQRRKKKSRSSATRLPRAARSGRATRPCVCDAESTCGAAGVACCVRGADALLTGRAARLRRPPSSVTLLLFCLQQQQQQQQQSQRRTAAGFADAWCSSRAASARAGRRLRCCACAAESLSW